MNDLERGTVTVFLSVFMFALLVVAGLVFDGGNILAAFLGGPGLIFGLLGSLVIGVYLFGFASDDFLGRVIVSLNMFKDGKLKIRTIFERSLEEVFLNPMAVAKVRSGNATFHPCWRSMSKALPRRWRSSPIIG